MWGQAKVSRDIQDVQAKYIERRKEFDIFVRDHLERNGEDRTRKFKTIWDDKGFNTQNGTQEVKAILGSDAMPFPKPVALLEAIIRFGVPGDGIVLDYFAGSGTTAQAVLERNELDGKDRQFILVQLPEPTDREDYRTIADIGKERLRLVIDKLNNEDVVALPLNEEAPRDRGFRVFKLSESNFATWEAAGVEKGSLPEQLAIHVEHVREDRSQQDLLFEILLKIGFDLTTMATAESIEGQTVYSIASGALMVCLSRSINLELIREVAKRAPERFVCLDEGFAGNDQLKVNAVQIFKSKNVVFKTV